MMVAEKVATAQSLLRTGGGQITEALSAPAMQSGQQGHRGHHQGTGCMLPTAGCQPGVEHHVEGWETNKQAVCFPQLKVIESLHEVKYHATLSTQPSHRKNNGNS